MSVDRRPSVVSWLPSGRHHNETKTTTTTGLQALKIHINLDLLWANIFIYQASGKWRLIRIKSCKWRSYHIVVVFVWSLVGCKDQLWPLTSWLDLLVSRPECVPAFVYKVRPLRSRQALRSIRNSRGCVTASDLLPFLALYLYVLDQCNLTSCPSIGQSKRLIKGLSVWPNSQKGCPPRARLI